MADAKAGRFDVVMVYNSDRIGRREDVFHSVVQPMFYDYRVPILDLSKPLQIDDPGDFNPFKDDNVTLHFGFAGMMASLDQRQRTRRLAAGTRKAAQDGRYLPPHPPYGYSYYWPEKEGERPQKQVVINQAEYPTLELIFQLELQERLSFLEIARRLDAMGIKPRKGLNWRKCLISRIVHNPFYAGVVYYGLTRIVQGGREVKNRDETKIIRTPYTDYPHPLEQADLETLATVWQTHRVHPARSHGAKNPLSGMLKCGRCGKTVALAKGKSGPHSATYTCLTHRDNKLTCPQPNIKAIYLFKCAWEELEQVAKGIDHKVLVGGGDAGNQAWLATLQAQIVRCNEELENLNQREENLIDDLADRVISREKYAETLARYASSRVEIEVRLQSLHSQADQLGEGTSIVHREIDSVSAWRELSEYASQTPYYEWPESFMREVKECLRSMFRGFRVTSEFEPLNSKWVVNFECDVI